MTKDVRLFKLMTNENVISEVVSEKEDCIVIKNCIQLMMMPAKSGDKEINFGFAPFPYFSNDKESSYTLMKQSIVFFTNTIEEDFLEQYNQIFNQILTPSAKKIILK